MFLYLGPTNSAKTHDAVQKLAAAGSGAFASPLRLLAREVFDKLCATLGPERVGLLTGEERINAGAPVVCCTTECTPDAKGGVLVLDEAHWLTDLERGHAWTRVLKMRGYSEMNVIAAPEAEALLLRAFAPLSVEVVRKRRLGELRFVLPAYDFSAKMGEDALPAAFVAFSRRSVLALAKALKRLGHEPAVVYGAMPPELRKSQIARLVSGECDVICTTDVIGHGVNLPLESIVVCETRKFDGVDVRDLYVWEAAQICGRAGRGSKTGRVFAGSFGWFDAVDEELLGRAVDAANGVTPTDLEAEFATVLPTLGDLKRGGTNGGLAASYDRWCRERESERESESDALPGEEWVRPRPSRTLRDRLAWIDEKRVPEGDIGFAWRVAALHVGEANWTRIAQPLLFGSKKLFAGLRPAASSAQDLEKYIAWLNDLRAVELAVPGVVDTDLEVLYQIATGDLGPLIAAEVSAPPRRCVDCDETLDHPFHARCDQCHRAVMRGHHYHHYDDDVDWDEDYEDHEWDEDDDDNQGDEWEEDTL